MQEFGAIVGGLGLLLLLFGLAMFLPVRVLRAKRAIAWWLTLGGLGCVIFGAITSPVAPSKGGKIDEGRKPTSEPMGISLAAAPGKVEAHNQAPPAPGDHRPSELAHMTVDERNYPIIAVSVYLGTPPVSANTISKAATSIKGFSDDLEQQDRWRAASVVNFSFSVGASAQTAHNFMYLSEDMRKMRELTALHRAAPAYLTIARDGHVVDVADERAARTYCSGTSEGFCSRYSL